jgi:hypothetical protein
MHPDRRSRHCTTRQPAGRGGFRVCRPGGRPRSPTAGGRYLQPAALLDPARACDRAETRTRSGPGPPTSRLDRSPPALCAAGAVSPAGGHRQSGRCGVLTRILVGAARDRRSRRGARASATTGPGETTRHGDEAAAPARAGFPSPLKFRGCVTVTPYSCCTLLENHFAIREFSTVAFAVAFPALLLHPLQHPCPTRCSFCSDSCRRQGSPSAGHYPAGPAGRPPLRIGPRAAPGPAGRDRFTPCAVTSTVTAPST